MRDKTYLIKLLASLSAFQKQVDAYQTFNLQILNNNVDELVEAISNIMN